LVGIEAEGTSESGTAPRARGGVGVGSLGGLHAASPKIQSPKNGEEKKKRKECKACLVAK